MNKKYINRSKHQVEKIKAKAAVSLKIIYKIKYYISYEKYLK